MTGQTPVGWFVRVVWRRPEVVVAGPVEPLGRAIRHSLRGVS